MKTFGIDVDRFVTLPLNIVEKYENTVGIPVTDVTIKDYIGLVFNEDANHHNVDEISEKICQYLKSEIEAYGYESDR